jgi:hypothetical protein
MSGVASETGSISPTIVAKIVIDNIMVTPEKNPSVNNKIKKIGSTSQHTPAG